jgi:hypothetical protein
VVAVAKVDGGGGGIIKDEAENNLFGMVAGLVLGVILEKVGTTAAELHALDLTDACLGGTTGAVVEFVNFKHTGAHGDGFFVVVVGSSDGEGAVLGVGLLASGALLGPVLLQSSTWR